MRTKFPKISSVFLKFLLIAMLILASETINAQCAMCRAALQGEENVTKAEAVNDGIVYLMVFPYLLVAGIGYYVYKTRNK